MIAEAILVALLTERPKPAREELRVARIAVAIEEVSRRVHSAGKWPAPRRALAAALTTAVIYESAGRRDVHSGALLGKAGERCLVQIHPVNIMWRGVSPSFEALTGIAHQNTVWCLQAGAKMLQWSARRCLARHYRKNWREAMWSAYHLTECWVSPERFRRARMMRKIARGPWAVTNKHRKLVREARRSIKGEKMPESEHPSVTSLLVERIKGMRVSQNLGSAIGAAVADLKEAGLDVAIEGVFDAESTRRMLIGVALAYQKLLYEAQRERKPAMAQWYAENLDTLIVMIDESFEPGQ